MQKRVHTADQTRQNWSVANIFQTTENCRKLLKTVANSVHTADADTTKQFCRVGVGGVKWVLRAKVQWYVFNSYGSIACFCAPLGIYPRQTSSNQQLTAGDVVRHDFRVEYRSCLVSRHYTRLDVERYVTADRSFDDRLDYETISA